MGNPPCLCGMPITCLWAVHTVIIGSPRLMMWEAHYISKGSPTIPCGWPTISLWDVHHMPSGSPRFTRWEAHCISKGSPLASPWAALSLYKFFPSNIPNTLFVKDNHINYNSEKLYYSMSQDPRRDHFLGEALNLCHHEVCISIKWDS